MANAHNTPPEQELIIPTKHELKLIEHVRLCHPKVLAKALRKAEEIAVYQNSAFDAKQLNACWLVRELARRVQRCSKPARTPKPC